MSDVIGRAGFHALHVKPAGDRGAVLHEMMREFDDDAIAYWADRNPNIVVEDSHLNEAFVNDGQGGFERCTDRKEVLEYGKQRLKRVGRKITEPKPDGSGGTMTTSLLVSHLPKSMCVEVPNYYPVIDQKTKEQAVDENGELKWRSRWVARDRDQARQYFNDVVEYLSEHVVAGGKDALLGYDIQHDETTPHIQMMFDAFEDHPTKKDPDNLRACGSRVWYRHRDVKDEKGRVLNGPEKMRNYHAGLKEFLIDKGYEISPDFDEERHMIGYTKEDFEKVQDQRSINESELARAEQRHSDARDREVAVGASERKVATAQKMFVRDRGQLRQDQEALKENEDRLQQNCRCRPEHGLLRTG